MRRIKLPWCPCFDPVSSVKWGPSDQSCVFYSCSTFLERAKRSKKVLRCEREREWFLLSGLTQDACVYVFRGSCAQLRSSVSLRKNMSTHIVPFSRNTAGSMVLAFQFWCLQCAMTASNDARQMRRVNYCFQRIWAFRLSLCFSKWGPGTPRASLRGFQGFLYIYGGPWEQNLIKQGSVV